MKHIPLHKLQNWAANDLVVRHTGEGTSRNELESLEVHRDDSYFFLLIEKGIGSVMVDFKTMPLIAGHIYFIAPGQVHGNIKASSAEAWYIGAMPSLIPKEYLKIFESHLLQQPTYVFDKSSFIQCRQVVQLLSKQYHSNADDIFYKPLTYALLNSFLCAAARAYASVKVSVPSASRPFQITYEFRKVLGQKFKSEKSPSYYASYLNISEGYLNEAVKESTGFTVTYWLMNEVMLEAKRLLAYSQLNVKEIAYTLGYDDHTYFSKLFKRQSKVSPTNFREGHLK